MVISPKNKNLAEIQTHTRYDFQTPPAWGTIVILGIQHFLTMCIPNAVSTVIIMNALCVEMDSPLKSQLISSTFFIMGFTTFLQTLLGSRLPIVQGASYGIVLPTVSLLNMPEIRSCNISENKFILDHFDNETKPESVFHLKMRLISGGLMVTSLVPIMLAATGVAGIFARLISPLSSACIYTAFSLAICEKIMGMMEQQWMISVMATMIMVIFTVILAPKQVPVPVWTRNKGFHLVKIKIFEISPVIMSLLLVWLICGILTWTGAFSKDPTGWGYLARTDIKLKAIYDAPIFQLPLPNQWGLPIVLVSAVSGMSAGVMISIINSLTTFAMAADVIKAPAVPIFASNRGIFIKGFCVFISGLSGAIVSPTSYSGSVGLIRLTKVGHNSVARMAASVMIIIGIFPVLGAIFVSIPDPAIGGIIFVTTLMILACGLDNLRKVNLKFVRNPIIFGLSVTFGQYLPVWASKNSQMIRTGYKSLDDTVQFLLSINMFIAAVISIVLDNTLPKEKAIPSSTDKDLKEEGSFSELETCTIYDSKFMRLVAKQCPCLQYLPLFPPYKKLEKSNSKCEVKENLISTI